MKEYIIDGNEFNDYRGAYFYIRDILSNYSEKENLTLKNLTKKHIADDEVTIVWINSEKSKNDLGYKETLNYYKKKLVNSGLKDLMPIMKKIKESERLTGATLFDEIIDSIKTKNVTIELK